MIVQNEIKINGTYYMYTYSDQDVMISRNGENYIDALDPHFLGREYEETNVSLSEEEKKSLFRSQNLELFQE